MPADPPASVKSANIDENTCHPMKMTLHIMYSIARFFSSFCYLLVHGTDKPISSTCFEFKMLSNDTFVKHINDEREGFDCWYNTHLNTQHAIFKGTAATYPPPVRPSTDIHPQVVNWQTNYFMHDNPKEHSKFWIKSAWRSSENKFSASVTLQFSLTQPWHVGVTNQMNRCRPSVSSGFYLSHHMLSTH